MEINSERRFSHPLTEKLHQIIHHTSATHCDLQTFFYILSRDFTQHNL